MDLFKTAVADHRELTLQILNELFGCAPFQCLRVRLWDGTYWPATAASSAPATVVLNHHGSLRGMLLGNSEAGLGEGYLQNDFDVEGDMEAAFELADSLHKQTEGWSRKLKIANLLWRLPARSVRLVSDVRKGHNEVFGEVVSEENGSGNKMFKQIGSMARGVSRWLVWLHTWVAPSENRWAWVALPLLFAGETCVQASAIPLSDGWRAPTPYDPYLHSVTVVLGNLRGAPPSFLRVGALMSMGSGFRVCTSGPYVPLLPEETEARRAGDCKDKALWLASKMQDPSVRFVIGKGHPGDVKNHVWLVWSSNGRWWILDPTRSSRPIAAEEVPPGDYCVWYSYDRSGSYCHSAAPPRVRRLRLESMRAVLTRAGFEGLAEARARIAMAGARDQR